MLTPPALAPETIVATLRDRYGLAIRQATFLPLGADANAAVYRVDAADGAGYFLKLKRGQFAAATVAVPAYLHARGILPVMAPLVTRTQRLWLRRRGYVWLLYPFFAGHNGFETPLSPAHWEALGRSLRAIHATTLPPALARLVPREDYAPRWRDQVTAFDEAVATQEFADPVARRLAAFWASQRDAIRTLVARAAELGQALRQPPRPFVLCHTDLHAGNVLLGADGALAIVDWDEVLFAPRERDLMFVGAGVGSVWDDPAEAPLFYRGYGATEPDPVALAYYRCERIVADLAAYGEQIFAEHGSLEDREIGLRNLMGSFVPGGVAEIADRTYQRLG